jgi:hypothetical protein
VLQTGRGYAASICFMVVHRATNRSRLRRFNLMYENCIATNRSQLRRYNLFYGCTSCYKQVTATPLQFVLWLYIVLKTGRSYAAIICFMVVHRATNRSRLRRFNLMYENCIATNRSQLCCYNLFYGRTSCYKQVAATPLQFDV